MLINEACFEICLPDFAASGIFRQLSAVKNTNMATGEFLE
jgi:hypothetical protein